MQKVESVQRKTTGFILNDYDRDSSVSKMMKELNLDFIELRRKVKKNQKLCIPSHHKKLSYQMP